jgi:hypothetical protein
MIKFFHLPRLVWAICSINFIFWVWLGVDVIHNIKPFTERPPAFEEIVPVYIFGNQAIPAISDHKMISLKTMRAIHQPIYFAVTKVANHISGGSWDQRWGSLSIGSFVLIVTMLLSFLQWGILAWAGASLIQSLKKDRRHPLFDI